MLKTANDKIMEWSRYAKEGLSLCSARRLQLANNLAYGGYDDWRVPTSLNANATGPCGQAPNCSGSEMEWS